MVKYNYGFKLMVVNEYLDSPLGFMLLAQKHGIKSSTNISKWVASYQKFGVEGLKRKKNNEVYSVQFKLDVLEFMKRTGASLSETALHFSLTNPPMITSWKKKFQEGGTDALDKPRGRPSMSNKRNKSKIKQGIEMTREQKLERENELLRLEVEYLKKLKAFQMDREGYLEEHKQRYHLNSKRVSD